MSRVFVFGSNLAGIHGAGSALEAKRHHGAIQWQGEGRQGDSYAIPTKDERFKTLPLVVIGYGVERFVQYAIEHPEDEFYVVKIGCGLAGLKESQMSPMFKGSPSNVFLPDGWGEHNMTSTGKLYVRRTDLGVEMGMISHSEWDDR
jgi:hypothetical protein